MSFKRNILGALIVVGTFSMGATALRASTQSDGERSQGPSVIEPSENTPTTDQTPMRDNYAPGGLLEPDNHH